MTSLCPVCYDEIPATVRSESGQAVMYKTCTEHDVFRAVVESDIKFYDHCRENHADAIYDGHLVDVTTRCNLKCRYCYYEKGDEDIQLPVILDNCHRAPGPYILTGGEPTLRSDMHDVIDAVKTVGDVVMLTNGYGLADISELKLYADQLTSDKGITQIGLSFHPEAPWLLQVVNNIVALNLKLNTVFFVIDSLGQLPFIVNFAERNGKHFDSIRIKIASAIWDEKKAAQLFASDVIKWFANRPATFEMAPTGKITYYVVKSNNILYAIVNWYNKNNVILEDIDTAPTYTTKDGQVMDFVKAMIYNEGQHGNTCG